MDLKGKKIVLGITGGIAAYKTADLARRWIKAGAEIEVVMTEAAQEFITPLTMESLINRKVHTELFPKTEFSATIHIDLADWADVLFIAPATANIISKLCMGQGDDLLSTICLAGWRKTVIAPAMNSNMWTNPAVQENLKVLQKRGYLIIEPTAGDLACGYTGIGRLPDPDILDFWIRYALTKKKLLKGKTVLITGGRTEEEIDPVRILTNRSSGRMGFALAEQSLFHGARVILVSGPTNLTPLPAVEFVSVVSAQEMEEAVADNIEDADIVIASAAVSDYRAKEILFRKMKKEKKEKTLNLVQNPDILAGIGKLKGKRILVGFAVETDNEEANARAKMRAKNLDMIILNNPVENGAGFATDTNKVTILLPRKKASKLPLLTKSQVAEHIIIEVASLLVKRKTKKQKE
jgi:phosphopantothenoylcysteine decarboxylase/phosphopantothenate--cysteine ligase